MHYVKCPRQISCRHTVTHLCIIWHCLDNENCSQAHTASISDKSKEYWYEHCRHKQWELLAAVQCTGKLVDDCMIYDLPACQSLADNSCTHTSRWPSSRR